MLSRPVQAILLLLILALLAGCQTATDAPQVTTQPTASGRTPKPVIVLPAGTPAPTATSTPDHPVVPSESLQGKKVLFWHPWQGEVEARAKAAVDEFNRSNQWGIEVSVRPFYSDGAMEEAVDAAYAIGTPDPASLPDVIAGTSAQLAVMGQAGAIADLNPYLKHPESGFSEAEIAAYLPAFWEQDVLGTARLGVPLLRTARVLYYNQTWAKELGYTTPPIKASDFKAQSCAAAVANNQSRFLEYFGTGGWLIDTHPLTGLSWFSAFGAEVAPAGQPVKFDSEEGNAAVAYLQDLGANACIWIPRSANPQEEFARRRALFYTGTLQDLFLQKSVMDLHQNKDEWTVLAFPGEEGAGPVLAYGYSLALTQREGIASDQQMAGWLFLRWLSEPAQQAKLAEVWPSFPVSEAVESTLSDYRANFPWNLVEPLQERIQPAPAGPQWYLASRVLEDVTWSIFHLPKEQTGDLLPLADETLREMLERQTAVP